jgi:hypothetical protein
MYPGTVHLHSVLRWVILILAILAIFKAIAGISGKKQYTTGDGSIALFTMISSHIMLLLGLYQWIAGPMGLKNIQNLGGMGAAMKDGAARFWAVEHFAGMFIAIILITLGARARKLNVSDLAKHKKVLTYFGLALLLILVSIPWPFRAEGVGRGLFPGM